MFAAGRAVYSELKNLCVWNKTNAGMGRFIAPSTSWCSSGSPERRRTSTTSNSASTDATAQTSGITPASTPCALGRLDELAMHPTVKPVALVADAIKDCSRRGGLVLDPFCGSGTILIAAERTGRKARALEIDPHYVDVAVRRWQAYTGKHALLAGSGEPFETTADRRLASLALA